jgi:ribosomal protein S27E
MMEHSHSFYVKCLDCQSERYSYKVGVPVDWKPGDPVVLSIVCSDCGNFGWIPIVMSGKPTTLSNKQATFEPTVN